MSFCPVNGESPCQCPHKPASDVGSALLTDYRSALRKVWTDHAVYTSLLIIESLPVAQPNAEAVTERLLKNPGDIRKLLQPIIGAQKSQAVEELITNHLLLAAGTLEPVRNGDQMATQQAVQKFYAQGQELGRALDSLLPQFHGLFSKLIQEHNEFVVQLATLRQEQKYAEYIQTYDVYYKHILALADKLYEGVSS